MRKERVFALCMIISIILFVIIGYIAVNMMFRFIFSKTQTPTYKGVDINVCNKIDFYPPFEEKEDKIQLELFNHYNHPLWVNCGGDSINENSNKLWKIEGDTVVCKMICSTYHYTEYYYTPLHFWYEFSYLDYKNWSDSRGN